MLGDRLTFRCVSDQPAQPGDWELQLHDRFPREAVLSVLPRQLRLGGPRLASRVDRDGERRRPGSDFRQRGEVDGGRLGVLQFPVPMHRGDRPGGGELAEQHERALRGVQRHRHVLQSRCSLLSPLICRPLVDVLAGERARAVQQPSQLQEVPVRRQWEPHAGASSHVDRADDAGETRGLLRNDAPRARRLRAGRAVDREAAEQHDADGSCGDGEWISCSLRCVE